MLPEGVLPLPAPGISDLCRKSSPAQRGAALGRHRHVGKGAQPFWGVDLWWEMWDGGAGAHSGASVAAAGWHLPGGMFANRDATFLPLSVIRATLQTQLGRERQGSRGPQSCFQPPGLSPGTLRCPSAWHGSCPCFALHLWKMLHGFDTGWRNWGCKFILQVEGCSLFWLLSLPHHSKS